MQRIWTCEDPSLVIFKINSTTFTSISRSSWRISGTAIMKVRIQNSRFFQACMSWVVRNIKRGRRWSFSVKKQKQKKKDDEGNSSDVFPRFSSVVVTSHVLENFKVYRVSLCSYKRWGLELIFRRYKRG